MLTQDNQDQFRDERPIKTLPRTFQEAMLVAHHFGVRFLWIDCLCIIQAGDDGRDWDTESGRMNVIYQHASCNISADDVSETDGLFFDRDLDFYRQVSVRTREKGGRRRRLDLSRQGHVSCRGEQLPTQQTRFGVSRAPIGAYGDTLLSPKRFCGSVVNVSVARASQSLQSAEFLDLSQTVSLRQLPSEMWEGCDWDGDENFPLKALPYELWNDMIKAYTKCQFSYPSDKLVAISGVAKFTKTVVKDTYLSLSADTAIILFLKKEKRFREVWADLMLVTRWSQPRSPDLLSITPSLLQQGSYPESPGPTNYTCPER